MEEDPVELSGCAAENDAVLLCYDATKDWRACRKELEAFKKCIKAAEEEKKMREERG